MMGRSLIEQEPAGWVPRVVRWLIERRWPLLLLGLLTAATAYVPARRLKFDQSVENMFAADDPVLVPFRQLKETFGGSEIALAAYVDPNLLTFEGMERLDEFTRKLRGVEGVESVLSLTMPYGPQIVDMPFFPQFLELFEGYTVGEDRQTTAVVCMLVPEERAPRPREETVEEMRSLVEAHDPTGVLTGEPVMIVDGFRYLEEDGRLLGMASTGLLMLTIVICFRSLRWVIVPMAVVNVTLQLTNGLLVMGDFRLSMVSSMLWAIITVVGVGMVVHVILRFREEREAGLSPRDALKATGNMLLVPIIWTSLTDTAGFGALLVARVGPVQDFGKMMTIASVLTLVSAAIILPGLVLWGRVDPDPKRAWGEGRMEVGLRKLVQSVERNPRAIGLLTLLFAGISMLGYLWLDVETDFTKNFRASSPVVKSYQFVESRLGGAGVWDVLVPAPTKMDGGFLDRVRKFETRLRDEVQVENEQGQTVPGLTKVLSLTDILDTLPLGFLGQETLLKQVEQQMPAIWNALWGEYPRGSGQHYLRVMLRARERQPSAEKERLIEQVSTVAAEEFPAGDGEPKAQVTGFFVLLTNLIDSMLSDQWRTFSVATVVIFLMMLVAFRNFVIAVVAMVPNLVPNLVLLGLLGWFNVRINIGTAMIAAVSMGLTVDSSIHYITEYRFFRRRGDTVHEALERSHQSVGRAVVFSTLALVVGFSALTLSQFVPLIYFGILVSVSLIGGLLGNLIVLPLILRATDRYDHGSPLGVHPQISAVSTATH